MSDTRKNPEQRTDLAHGLIHTPRPFPEAARHSLGDTVGMTEADLRERLAAIVESSDDAIISKNLDGVITSWNPAAERLYGYPAEEAIGQSKTFVIPPDQSEELLSTLRRIRNGERIAHYETRRIRKDGTLIDVSISVSPIKNAAGEIIGASTIARDITLRKREEVRREFLQQASEVIGSSLDYTQTLQQVARLAVPKLADWCAVDMVEEDGSLQLLAVSHVDPAKVRWAYELRQKYPPDLTEQRGLINVLRTGVTELYPSIRQEWLLREDFDEERLEIVRQLGFISAMFVPMIARGRILGGISFLTTRESGQRYTVEDQALAESLAARAAIAVDNARLYQAAQQEIAQRKQTEQDLRNSRRQLETILEGIGDGITAQDTTGRVVFANSAAARASGFHTVEEFLSTAAQKIVGRYELLDEQGRPFPVTELPGRRVLEGGNPPETLLRIRARATGEERWVLIKATPVREENGEVQLAINFFQDVTERRRMEEAIHISEERVRAIIDNTSSVITMKDREGRYLLVNRAFERLNEISLEEAKGKTDFELFPPQFAALIVASDKKVLESGEAMEYEEAGPYEDRTVTFISTRFPLRDRHGNIYAICGVSTDISERKQQEEAIEVLNARLKRAMAETHHRVKNNLQIIAALVEMQVGGTGQTVPTEALRRVGQHVQALAAVHDILTREARESGTVEYLSTRETLEKLRPLLERLVGERQLHFRVEDLRLPIQQGTSLAVLVNELISNAVKHGAGDIDLSLAVAAERGHLQVRDRGPGFPEGFDPETAANTGLELILSLSRWDLGGDITFQNHPGGGGLITVTFPLKTSR